MVATSYHIHTAAASYTAHPLQHAAACTTIIVPAVRRGIPRPGVTGGGNSDGRARGRRPTPCSDCSDVRGRHGSYPLAAGSAGGGGCNAMAPGGWYTTPSGMLGRGQRATAHEKNPPRTQYTTTAPAVRCERGGLQPTNINYYVIYTIHLFIFVFIFHLCLFMITIHVATFMFIF